MRIEEQKKATKDGLKKRLDHLTKCHEEGSMTDKAVDAGLAEIRQQIATFQKLGII